MPWARRDPAAGNKQRKRGGLQSHERVYQSNSSSSEESPISITSFLAAPLPAPDAEEDEDAAATAGFFVAGGLLSSSLSVSSSDTRFFFRCTALPLGRPAPPLAVGSSNSTVILLFSTDGARGPGIMYTLVE